MSSDWRAYRLQEVGRLVTGKTPKSGVPAFYGDDVPFVSPPDFSGNKWITKTVRSISEAGAQSVKGSLIPPNSVLVTCIGSDMGKAAIAAFRCVTNQQINAILVDESRFCPEFVYYNLSLRKDEIRSLAGGSAQPILNKSAFGQLLLEVPSIEAQREVTSVLRPIDDRITLLRETNATLEAIAQALFKSWFVDFDPVRAKVEGRLPEGMDEATAALFPDVLEETELGLVPKEWQVCAVEDFAEKVGMGPFGSNIKVETFVESGVPVISGQHLKQMMVEDNTFNFITPEHAQKLAKSCVQHGDVIFTHAGSIGQVSYLHKDSEYQSYVLSQRQFFLRCDPSLMSPQWITRFFKSPAGQHLLLANTSQVGVPSIARPVTYLRSIRLVIPPSPVMQQFSLVCAALDDRVMCNRKHIAALTQARDTLLPRLISGQLRLPEAKVQLEDALA